MFRGFRVQEGSQYFVLHEGSPTNPTILYKSQNLATVEPQDFKTTPSLSIDPVVPTQPSVQGPTASLRRTQSRGCGATGWSQKPCSEQWVLISCFQRMVKYALKGPLLYIRVPVSSETPIWFTLSSGLNLSRPGPLERRTPNLDETQKALFVAKQKIRFDLSCSQQKAKVQGFG